MVAIYQKTRGIKYLSPIINSVDISKAVTIIRF